MSDPNRPILAYSQALDRYVEMPAANLDVFHGFVDTGIDPTTFVADIPRDEQIEKALAEQGANPDTTTFVDLNAASGETKETDNG